MDDAQPTEHHPIEMGSIEIFKADNTLMLTEEENQTFYSVRISNQVSEFNISALSSLYSRNKQETVSQ